MNSSIKFIGLFSAISIQMASFSVPAFAVDCEALQAKAQEIGQAAESINNGQTQESICMRAKKVQSDIAKFMKANTAGLKECGASDADIKAMKNSLPNSEIVNVCGSGD